MARSVNGLLWGPPNRPSWEVSGAEVDRVCGAEVSGA